MDGGLITFIVLASVGLIVLLIVTCICCPICILAKVLGRNRRGVVYESPANGSNGATTTIVTQGRRQIIVNVRQQPQTTGRQQASTTPANRNAPYPVQPTVPAAMGHGMQNSPYAAYPQVGPNAASGYPPGMPMPQPGYPSIAMPAPGVPYAPAQALPDLPPPYPGLGRDNDAFQTQPPFNPHFDQQTENLIAAATRASAPTKQ